MNIKNKIILLYQKGEDIFCSTHISVLTDPSQIPSYKELITDQKTFDQYFKLYSNPQSKDEIMYNMTKRIFWKKTGINEIL